MQLRRVGLLNHPAYYGRSHPLNRRYRGLVDETFSLQGGQLLAAARLLNKTRQVFAMSAIKSFETPDRLEDLALLGLQKTHQAIARRQIYFNCKSPFPAFLLEYLAIRLVARRLN